MLDIDRSKVRVGGMICLLAASMLELQAIEGWPIETTSEATKGAWMENFAMATNLAFKTKTPMIMFWANSQCEYCERLENAINSDEFKAWQAAHPDYIYNFVFASGGVDQDPNADSGAMEFAWSANGTITPLNLYPFVCLYWPKADGTMFAASRVGRAGLMDEASYRAGKPLVEEFEAFIETQFSEYSPEQSIPEYVGGELAFSAEYDNARLEAEVGNTKYVNIPLRRDVVTEGYVGTNTIKAIYGDETILDNALVWDEQQTSASVAVPIPADAIAGEKIAVTLYDDSGAARGTVNVHVVAERENSPKNPYFVGERTVDQLQYGEWTMDIDVAMAKYRANADSKLLALVGGSLWCPDCVMTDAHLLDRAEFREWAAANKVILVDIDIPNLPNTTSSPSLLTRIVSRTSDSYVTGRGTIEADEAQRYQSGAGYLSRHMVSEAAAAEIIERNRKLAGTNTLNGGWNSPDRANQNRTGVPIFVTLRRDGTLSGRLETFSAVAPSEFKSAYLNRLDELLATSDDASGADEEANASWQTTANEFSGVGTSSGATLSAVDLVDTYELAPIAEGAVEQSVTVAGENPNTTVTVSLLQVMDGMATTLATAEGTLSDQVTVRGAVGIGARYYVQISAAATGTLAIDSDSPSTVAAYTITGTRAEIANPYSNDWIARAATAVLPLYGSENGDTVLLGTLTLNMRKNKTISAKYSDGKKTLATFSGRWSVDDIAADGTARLALERKGYALVLSLKADGTIDARISNGDETLSSGECGLSDSYPDFAGYYTVLLPELNEGASSATLAGPSFMTLKMLSASMQKAGRFSYVVYLANGAKLSGSAYVTWYDADFGIVPILKVSGGYTVAISLKIRKDAGKAPSSRAVVALRGVTSRVACAKSGKAFDLSVGAYGSRYDKDSSLADQGHVDSGLKFVWTADTSQISDSSAYGALESVTGNGSGLTVGAKGMAATGRTNGFSFKFNKTTGIFSGKTTLAFERRPKLSAKYLGIVLPGWFTDCDCSEDDDKLIPIVSLPFGVGYCVFSDKADHKTVTRSLPVEIDLPAE